LTLRDETECPIYTELSHKARDDFWFQRVDLCEQCFTRPLQAGSTKTAKLRTPTESRLLSRLPSWFPGWFGPYGRAVKIEHVTDERILEGIAQARAEGSQVYVNRGSDSPTIYLLPPPPPPPPPPPVLPKGRPGI